MLTELEGNRWCKRYITKKAPKHHPQTAKIWQFLQWKKTDICHQKSIFFVHDSSALIAVAFFSARLETFLHLNHSIWTLETTAMFAFLLLIYERKWSQRMRLPNVMNNLMRLDLVRLFLLWIQVITLSEVNFLNAYVYEGSKSAAVKGSWILM